jgi:hypothetical protein
MKPIDCVSGNKRKQLKLLLLLLQKKKGANVVPSALTAKGALTVKDVNLIAGIKHDEIMACLNVSASVMQNQFNQ